MNNILRYYGAQSHYGSEIPLACAGIITKVNMIFFSLVIGLSQGLQPIVSFNYGARKFRRVREAYLKAVLIATMISTLSFLGLGVQAPTPEWGAMLSEAKNVLTSNPAQMLVPGIAIVVLVSAFNLMGDAIRDVLDPKEVL